MPEPNSAPKVLISYSHDSPEHMARVLALSDRLRAEGVDSQLDQYETSPPEGWPRWTLNQIEWADFVLVVCTATYDRRFRGREEAGKGRGVTWEGFVLTQDLYDAAAHNTKFIPVVFSGEDAAHIPLVLRGATLYVLEIEEHYEALYRRLTSQPRTLKPQIGERHHFAPQHDRRPSPPETRRIDAACPSHAAVDEQIDLLVQVRLPSSPLLGIEDWPNRQRPDSIRQTSSETALEFPIDPRTGKPGSARLEIRLVAPDFNVSGAAQKIVEVPPDRDSLKVKFLMSAKRPGVCKIDIEVYKPDQTYLGTVPLETVVGGAAPQRQPAVANLVLRVIVEQESRARQSEEARVRQQEEEARARQSISELDEWPVHTQTEVIVDSGLRTTDSGVTRKDEDKVGTTSDEMPIPDPLPDRDKDVRPPPGSKLGLVVLLVLIAGAAALTIPYLPSDSILYAGKVVDAKTGQAISGARVRVESEGTSQVFHTNADGTFRLKLNDLNDKSHIAVEAQGFEVLRREEKLAPGGVEGTWLMTPEKANGPAPPPTGQVP